MAQKRVTLSKDGREISLALPQDIVEYKAAGWREKDSASAAKVETNHVKNDDTKGGSKK